MRLAPALLLAGLLASSFATRAAASDPTLTATLTAAESPAPGTKATLSLVLELPKGFHTYAPDSPEGGALVIEYSDRAGMSETGELRFPEPTKKFEELLGGMVHELKGSIRFEQDFTVGAEGGTLSGVVELQFCDARICKQKKLSFSLPVPVAGGSKPASAPSAGLGDLPGLGAIPGLGKVGSPSDRAAVKGVRFEPTTAAPGSIVRLVVDVEVTEGYHVYAPTTPSEYAIKLAVTPDPGSPFQVVGAMVTPTPKIHVDESLGETFHELEGRFEASQEVRVAETASGEVRFSGKLEGQACDATSCENFDYPLVASLTVSGDPVKSSASGATDATDSRSMTGESGAVPPKENEKESLLGFLLTAIGAGLLSLLMPCVFPMIPITVSVFTKQAQGNRAASIRLAAIYGISIIVVFTAIGVLCSVIFGAGGANMIGSNPWINVALGALFVVFGLSLLGAFEIRLPSFLIQSAAGAQQRASGVVQVVMMAVVFTLTSFTCTVPFVGALLVRASTGDYTWPLLGMLAFSSTFALPFFLLALAPTLLGSLPSAGSWMNTAKITMGLVEFAFALKFFSNADLVWNLELLTRPNYLAAWVMIGLVTTLYLLGRLRVGYDLNDEPIGPYRVVTALCFGWTTIYLATGFLGTRFGDTIEGLLPPSNYGVAAARSIEGSTASNGAAHEFAFFDSYGKALAAAREQDKPLFLDFTGVTCVNCRAMEENVFPLPEVRRYLDQFVLVQLYVDKGPEKDFNANLQVERFQNSAQPYYAVLDPKDEKTLGVFEGYAATPELVTEFIAMLESASLAHRESRK